MKIRNRTLIRSLARLVAFGSRCLFITCRKNIIEDAPRVSPYTPHDESYLYCVWHDNMLGALFSGRTVKMAALTSRHADGEYVAEVMEAVGIQPFRGSSNHGGATAVRQLMDAAQSYDITITSDGPRGPRRVIKPGIVFLASQSGRKIIPVAFAAKRAWKPQGKWTDLVVPKPFTTCHAIGGAPMEVPPNLSRDQLGPYVEELQRRMDELQLRADRLAGSECVGTIRGEACRKPTKAA
ncbi:MAG: lysophospholipid acyltransferase family protein [Planctomycetaceae bacterium]|nr:lysophospholipid acyltransferase family protein [Planctomycetaceae bacterium]